MFEGEERVLYLVGLTLEQMETIRCLVESKLFRFYKGSYRDTVRLASVDMFNNILMPEQIKLYQSILCKIEEVKRECIN